MRLHLLLPLLSSWLFVAGSLLVKRTAELGVGAWRTNFVANVATALFFAPLLLLGGPGQPLTALWQPALTAALLVVGQGFAFYALSRGDVSVATPVLGVKTVLVAFFTTLVLAQAVPVKLWLGAALSTLAILLLHRTRDRSRRHVVASMVFAVLAALCFALFDVLVQKWSPRWGVGRFLPAMSGLAALLSVGLSPFFRAPLRAIPRAVWPWLLGGAGLIALQSLALISTVAIFGDATAVNIVYSSRGLWSVVAVWLVGHWVASQEQHLGRRVLAWRLAGAATMTAAIVLVLV